MTSDQLADLLDDRALLVAVGEQVARSMNGPRSQRLAAALDELSLDRSGAFLNDDDRTWLERGITDARSESRDRFWSEQLRKLADRGVSVTPCTSMDYPANLQLVHDRPPFLFVRGRLDAEDQRAIAIVGTREASAAGTQVAHELAAELSQAGITIVSGLAKGIDTAAHTAAVNLGHRTVAVFGTPLDRVYPAQNRELAEGIVEADGACVSQFLPGTNTARWGFPVRNVTMSGLAVGTVVVEAGDTSGARIQAEAAVAHGKRVFLVDQLVTKQEWAREMVGSPNVTVASNAPTILDHIERLLHAPADIRL